VQVLLCLKVQLKERESSPNITLEILLWDTPNGKNLNRFRLAEFALLEEIRISQLAIHLFLNNEILEAKRMLEAKYIILSIDRLIDWLAILNNCLIDCSLTQSTDWLIDWIQLNWFRPCIVKRKKFWLLLMLFSSVLWFMGWIYLHGEFFFAFSGFRRICTQPWLTALFCICKLWWPSLP
jgi:hypothetical protein